ncbi:MAG: lipB [Sphingomonas bacterium]|jgi:lipoyl(octanoyl) transferase|nr:lipB [Sphingomonas bacterium]
MPHDEIEWRVSDGLTPYDEALAAMEARVAAIREGNARELIWLLEHPPLYTAGTSAKPGDLIVPDRFPVHAVGRGGQYTYHGPGQRVGYLMLDLDKRGRDVRRFVHGLEAWLIDALKHFSIIAHTDPGRVGIWVPQGDTEAKIGAIGVRVRKWVTMHGFAMNIAPDLTHFDGIVPCGLPEFPVTSIERIGGIADMKQFDDALRDRLDSFLSGLESPATAA